jgi:hypothetical protein
VAHQFATAGGELAGRRPLVTEPYGYGVAADELDRRPPAAVTSGAADDDHPQSIPGADRSGRGQR